MLPAFLYALTGGFAYVLFLVVKLYGLRILGMERMETGVKEEMAETVMFTLLVSLLVSIGDLTNFLASLHVGRFSFSEIPNVVAKDLFSAYSQLFRVYSQARSIYMAQMARGYGGSFGIFQVDLTDFFRKEPNYREMARASFIMQATLSLLEGVSIGISAVQYLETAFPYLLALGVLLRCFKYTSAWGAAILGLLFGFYFVYPSVLYGFSFTLPPEASLSTFRFCSYNIGGTISISAGGLSGQLSALQNMQDLLASILTSFVLMQLTALSSALVSAYFITQVLSRGVAVWLGGMRFFYYL
jgi:hypothetical protein